MPPIWQGVTLGLAASGLILALVAMKFLTELSREVRNILGDLLDVKAVAHEALHTANSVANLTGCEWRPTLAGAWVKKP